MAAATSGACVSGAKCLVSKKRTVAFAFAMSRLNASALAGRKNGSFLPPCRQQGRRMGSGNTPGRSDRARRWSCSRTGRSRTSGCAKRVPWRAKCPANRRGSGSSRRLALLIGVAVLRRAPWNGRFLGEVGGWS